LKLALAYNDLSMVDFKAGGDSNTKMKVNLYPVQRKLMTIGAARNSDGNTKSKVIPSCLIFINKQLGHTALMLAMSTS
jgi:hypothetical protein